MKLGIIGLPQSGKSTVFESLTKSTADMTHKGENRISTIRVPDNRIDILSEMYRPQKTIYAQVEYFLPGTGSANKNQAKEQSIWAATRECDALIHVIRNFSGAGIEKTAPYEDFRNIEQELILTDLVVVEKRLERIELDHKRGKKTDPREHTLLIECRKNLENEIPLRRVAELASARELRGFTLLSAKPMLVLFNNDEENNGMPEVDTPHRPGKLSGHQGQTRTGACSDADRRSSRISKRIQYQRIRHEQGHPRILQYFGIDLIFHCRQR